MRRCLILVSILSLGATQPPVTAPQTPAPVPSTPPPPPDRCGAKDLQYLVGQPRTEIPIPIEPGLRRVICTTCPRSDDHRPERQTILFDQATSLVTSVTCD